MVPWRPAQVEGSATKEIRSALAHRKRESAYIVDRGTAHAPHINSFKIFIF